jgi:hypothetical protein
MGSSPLLFIYYYYYLKLNFLVGLIFITWQQKKSSATHVKDFFEKKGQRQQILRRKIPKSSYIDNRF